MECACSNQRMKANDKDIHAKDNALASAPT